MKLSSRLLRRVIIAVIFLATFVLLGYGTRQLTQAPATCVDGIKNGLEEGVDCGVQACGKECEPDLGPPEIVSTKLIEAGENDYDFVAEILNPHKEFGASEVVYELIFYNGNDEEILKEEGIFYILPAQTKYLVLTFITTERNVTKTEMKIKSAKWQKIDSLEGMNLIVRNEKYTIAGNGRSSSLEAVILNDSDFDFDTVDIEVVLKDSAGKIIAANRSEIRTFVARTERQFSVTWPFAVKGKVSKIEIKPSTNLFENSNFIKSYGSEVEKFQEY